MAYLHPGVYIEEIPSGSQPIEGVGTSTAVFIGSVDKGPIDCPTLITKYEEYVTVFGGIRDSGANAVGDAMGLSVQAFFTNGGTKAYIARLSPGADEATGDSSDVLDRDTITFTAKNPGEWGNGLEIRVNTVPTPRGMTGTFFQVDIGRTVDGEFVVEEGYGPVSSSFEHPLFFGNLINDGSELVTVAVTENTAPDQTVNLLYGYSQSGDLAALTPADFDLSGVADSADRTLSITLDGAGPAIEVELAQQDYSNLAAIAAAIQETVRNSTSTAEKRRKFTCSVMVDGAAEHLVLTSGTRKTTSAVAVAASTLATTLVLGGTEVVGSDTHPAAEPTNWSVTLASGSNGSDPERSDYQGMFTKLEKYRDANVVLLPGQTWSESGNPIIDDGIAHCEKMKSRMIIVDPPRTELENGAMAETLALPTSTYSVSYYPWVAVNNSFYDAERNPGAPRTVLTPPSAFAAGMWSKIDSRRGVWKAPAGVEASLLGLAGLEHVVEDAEQDFLNPAGINCLRKLPGFGSVIWGSRTLATRANPEWRYVPVRRTAIMIEQSIFNGIQWAVFEPNNHQLWSSLRTNIGSFMNGLFRAGAFQGEKASDAYFVRCGLGDTMTQADIDRGQVIAIVGFAPLKPAEFVIVRIQQKVGQE